ncbi:MAG: hypothetical protein WCR31_02315 [Treponema sp.]
MTTWYSIDTAGKLFPSVSDSNNSSFFRVAAVLREAVNPVIFQETVNRVRPRFSFFFVRLRRGTFWNYLEENNEPFLVEQETDFPCTASQFGRHDSHLIRFLYSGNRLSIELFHSITDGKGAMEFLKTVLFNYFVTAAENNKEIPAYIPENIVNIQSVPVIDDYENSFLRFTRLNRKDFKLEIRKFPPNSYHIKGISHGEKYSGVITGLLDSEQFNKYARSKETTVTGCFTAMLIYSIYTTRIKFGTEKKPVVISVPVNLRKRFPSVTFRNFFVVVNIAFSFNDTIPEDAECLFDTILKSVSIQLEELTRKENLQREIDKIILFDKNRIGRWVPLRIKHLFVRLGFNLFGEARRTITLSNMGELELPSETAHYVDHAEALLYPSSKCPVNCAIVTVNGVMSVSFTRTIEETDIIRSFFMLLKQKTGLQIQVYSNENQEK